MIPLGFSSAFYCLSICPCLTLCCSLDVSYFDLEGPDSVADHEAIAEHILNSRRSLKNALAVSFKEHSADLVRVLNEAAHDMPVLSLLLDHKVYEESSVNTFANLGFADELVGRLAGERCRDAGIQRALCLKNDQDNALLPGVRERAAARGEHLKYC